MKNVTLGPSNIFDFLNIRPFSPGGFWTFLVALAHGVPPYVRTLHWHFWPKFLSFHYSSSGRDGRGIKRSKNVWEIWKCIIDALFSWYFSSFEILAITEAGKIYSSIVKSKSSIRFGNLKGIGFKSSTVHFEIGLTLIPRSKWPRC